MPAWITPLEWPVWCAAIRGSRSSTATRRSGSRRPSSRATARPTIPAPTTATSHCSGGRGADTDARLAAWRFRSSRRSSRSWRSRASSCPSDDGWAYEPKYDGFRALAFVDGDELFLQSRSGRPLARYFPELDFPEGRYVIDGELVILDDDGREVFDALQNRLHPAESRVKMLAEQTPALFRAFDLLAVGRPQRARGPVHRAPRGAREADRRAGTIRARSSSRRWSATRPRPSRGSRAARA